MLDRRKLVNIYISFVLLTCAVFGAVQLMDNTASDWLVMEHNYDWMFSDHFRHILFSSNLENVYADNIDASFPPFAYLFYYLLYRINQFDLSLEYSSIDVVRDLRFNLVVYLYITAFLVVAFVYVTNRLLDSHGLARLFPIAILLSAPFLAGAIERGNPAFLVVDCLLYALYFKDSSNRTLRALALILIAVAVGFKIYPAIFGLLYLKEKRWKEAFWLTLCGLTVGLVPFLFTGGMEGMMDYIHDLAACSELVSIRFTDIRSYCNALVTLLGGDANNYIATTKMVELVALILMLGGAIISKTYYKTIFYLSCIMATYANNSYRYTSIYMVIAFVCFMKETPNQRMTLAQFVLFALIFCIPVYGYPFGGDVDALIFTPIYLLLIVNLLEDGITLWQNWTDREAIS